MLAIAQRIPVWRKRDLGMYDIRPALPLSADRLCRQAGLRFTIAGGYDLPFGIIPDSNKVTDISCPYIIGA